MRYNPHAFLSPITSGADLALRLALIRQGERETGTKYPNTTEAVIREWEKSR